MEDIAKAYQRLHRKETDEIVEYAYGLECLLERLETLADNQNKLIYDITKENDRLTMENVELKKGKQYEKDNRKTI